MKKLLKISALALAMSALLFSCADPNNGTKAPTVENVKPSDVTKPEGFTPTPNAKSVTTKADAETVLNKIMPEYGQYFEVLYSDLNKKVMADPKNAKEMEKAQAFQEDMNKKMAEGKDFSSSLKVAMTPASYTFDYGTSELVLDEESGSTSMKFKDGALDQENSSGEMKEHKIAKIDVKDPTKISSAVATNYIKAFVASAGLESSVSNTTESSKQDMKVSAMFEVEGFTGIVVLEMTKSFSADASEIDPNTGKPKVTKTEEMSYTFYDLEGNETLKKTPAN